MTTTTTNNTTESANSRHHQQQHDEDRIGEGSYVLLALPSTNVKMVTVKELSTISAGKYGTFPCRDIIGHPYGLLYQIQAGRAVIQNTTEEFEEIVETEANNQNALDDSANQKLSYEEIEQLKKSTLDGGLSGDKLIEQVISNHSKFEEKTEYSKAKYIKRKSQKFLRYFRTIKPNQYSMAQFFYKKNPIKIKDLRMDTLSQIMTLGNIFPGGRYLIVDDTQGLIVGSIMERLGGEGMAVALHETEFANYDIVRYFNFNLTNASTLFQLRLDKLHKDYVSELTEPVTLDDTNAILFEKYQRRVRARESFEKKRLEVLAGGFDGLIIASNSIQPYTIVSALSHLLAPSRPVVIYSMFKELLMDSVTQMRENPLFLHPQLTESWLREYQVLPGRTHPDMTAIGPGGYLVTATTIIDRGDSNAITAKILRPTKRPKSEGVTPQ